MNQQPTLIGRKFSPALLLLGFISCSTAMAANGPIQTGEFRMPPAANTAPRLAARGEIVRAGDSKNFPIAVMRIEHQADGSSINICRIEHTRPGHAGQPVLQQTQEPQR